jgi:hypothetical protein
MENTLKKISILAAVVGMISFNSAYAGASCTTEHLAGWWYQSAYVKPFPPQPGAFEGRLNCMIYWDKSGNAAQLTESTCQVQTAQGYLTAEFPNAMLGGYRTMEMTDQGCAIVQRITTSGGTESVSRLRVNVKGNSADGFGSTSASTSFSLSASKTARSNTEESGD